MVDYQLTNNSILNRSVNFHTNNSHQAQLPIAGKTGGNPLLPSNWHQLTEVERSGMVFQMLVQNQVTIQSLAQDYREMRNELRIILRDFRLLKIVMPVYPKIAQLK